MYAAHYADPRQLAVMQEDLKTSALFRKKAAAWDKAHGLGYHLITVGLIVALGPIGLLMALGRTNPHSGIASSLYARYEMTHDEIAKAHGLPTRKEIHRYVAWGTLPAAWKDAPSPKRPTQARRPSPRRATLAA